MLSTEQEQFARLLAAVGEVYNRQMTPTLTKLYWRALASFSWKDVVKAFEAHVRDPDTGHFMPKPADVIRVIKGDSEAQCLQAWSKVERAIRSVGPYQSVAFDDASIHAVLEQMGGWIKLCRSSEKSLPFTAKEFQTRYKAYRYQAPIHYPRYFMGVSEHQNSQYGSSNHATILIGDRDKAYAVMSGGSEDNHLSLISRITKGLLLGVSDGR
ncbi:MAG: DUF6475 domain-containing protein [Gammaproteobacteria bacterium]